MYISSSSKVKDKDGAWGTVVPGSPHLPSNTAQVVVQLENGQQLLVPTDVLVKLTPCGRTRALARRTPSSRHCIRDIPAWACHRYIPHEI
jgi:hypothetical protein